MWAVAIFCWNHARGFGEWRVSEARWRSRTDARGWVLAMTAGTADWSEWVVQEVS